MIKAIRQNDHRALSLAHQGDSTIFQRKINHGRTLAHLSAIQESDDCLTTIIKLDRNCLSITDDNGRTPLHYAAGYNRLNNFITIMKHMSELLHQGDYVGMKPVHYAAENKCELILQYICKNHKDTLISTDHSKNTAADFARKRRHLDLLILITESTPSTTTKTTSFVEDMINLKKTVIKKK